MNNIQLSRIKNKWIVPNFFISIIMLSSLQLFSQAKSLSINNSKSLQYQNYKDSISFWKEKNIDTTIFYAQKYFEQSILHNNQENIINSSSLLSNLFHSQSNYVNELNTLIESIEYLVEDKYLIQRADFLLQMSEATRAAGKFNAGLKYLSEAENIYSQKEDNLKLARTYNRKAAIYFEMENVKFTNTLLYLDKSINKAKEFNDYELISRNLEIKGAVYSSIGEYEKALNYYMQVIKIFEDNGEEAFPNIYINLCIVYYRLENYNLSVKYGKKALALEKKKCSMPQLETVYDMMSNTYVALGDYRNAYEYIIKSYNYQALLFNENRDNKITELNKKYQTEKKEQEIETQKTLIKYNNLKIKRKQNENIFLIIGILISVFVLFVFYIQKRKMRTFNKQLNFKNDKIETQSNKLKEQNSRLIELDKFKNSMNSMLVHDLKNPLNVILGNSQDENGKNILIYNSASKMLTHILNLLDVNKYENSSMILNLEEFKIQDLINTIYNEIKYTLESKNIRFQTNISKNYILNADKGIIERVLINLLSNAIKYTPQNGKITLSASPKNDKLLNISISNTGAGIPENMHEFIFEKYGQINNDFKTNSTGLGLAFCKIAIEAHGEKIKITKNKQDGAEFIFNISYIADKTTILFCKTKELLKTKQKTNKITYNISDLEKLKPFVEKLKEFDVGCITNVQKVITEINKLNIKSAEIFTNDILTSLKTCNQDQYDLTIKLISDENI